MDGWDSELFTYGCEYDPYGYAGGRPWTQKDPYGLGPVKELGADSTFFL